MTAGEPLHVLCLGTDHQHTHPCPPSSPWSNQVLVFPSFTLRSGCSLQGPMFKAMFYLRYRHSPWCSRKIHHP